MKNSEFLLVFGLFEVQTPGHSTTHVVFCCLGSLFSGFSKRKIMGQFTWFTLSTGGDLGVLGECIFVRQKTGPLKLAACAWKWMVGILVSFWDALFFRCYVSFRECRVKVDQHKTTVSRSQRIKGTGICTYIYHQNQLDYIWVGLKRRKKTSTLRDPGSTENPPYQWYCKELSINYNPSASFAGCGHPKSKGTTPMPIQERPGLQVFCWDHDGW